MPMWMLMWIAWWLPADFAAGVKAYENRDFTGAYKEWLPLAEEGNSAAQFNLGLLYYDGNGVPQNFSEAARWFQEAADRGWAKAQYNLGAMYGAGRGVKRDYSKAYVWLSLCAAQGDEKCVAQRDLVAHKLSPSKLSAAQDAARQFQPKKGPSPP